MTIKELEWQIAKGKILENLKNLEIAQRFGISHENNVSRIHARFLSKIEQMEKDLCEAIELGLYEPKFINREFISFVVGKKSFLAPYRSSSMSREAEKKLTKK